MKKRCFAAALALCMAVSLGAQEGGSALPIGRYSNVGLLNAGTYAQNFINPGTNLADTTYIMNAKMNNRTEAIRIAGLNNNSAFDTAEEIALLSATSGVINIRPVEAADMLPADDPALVDLQLGAMLYMKKATVGFLGNGDPAKYAVEIKFITGRGRVTEADIVNFVKQGIAQAVDAEFNKISFSLRNTSTSHNAVLTLDIKNKQYILSYEGYYTNAETRTLSASTLDALLSEMRNGKYKADFDATGIQSVHNKAALMPSMSRIRGSNIASSVLFTEIVAGFYTAKTLEEQNRYYKAMLGFEARLHSMILTGQGSSAEPIMFASGRVLNAISPELARKSANDSLNLTNVTDLNNEVDRVESLISRR